MEDGNLDEHNLKARSAMFAVRNSQRKGLIYTSTLTSCYGVFEVHPALSHNSGEGQPCKHQPFPAHWIVSLDTFTLLADSRIIPACYLAQMRVVCWV